MFSFRMRKSILFAPVSCDPSMAFSLSRNSFWVARSFARASGEYHENGSSHEHQNCEEREVLIVGQLACAISVQVPRVKLSNEELAEGDSEKPQRHDGALHRVRGLSV